MKQQVTRFSVLQTSKIMAVLYVFFGAIYSLIGIPMIIFGEGELRIMGIFYLLMPLIMGVLGFIGIAFFCWLYNVIAKMFGGIEFVVEEVAE